MHSETTLDYLESQTKVFGKLMRSFRDITKAEFNTTELPGEIAARKRRSLAVGDNGTTQQRGPRKKILNLLTYKFHALGDYVQTIRLFGTTDSYSTQLVCITDLFTGVFRHSSSCRVNLHTEQSSVCLPLQTKRTPPLKLQRSIVVKLVRVM